MREFIDIMESFGTVLNFDPQVDSTLFDLDRKAHSGEITPAEIKAFARFLRDHKMDYIRLYHGTSAKHDVMGKGLLPTSATRSRSLQSSAGYVYLSYDPNSALTFGQMGYANEYTTDTIVYAVDVLVRRLSADKDQLFNKRMWSDIPDIGETVADSLIYGRGARVRGRIDPMQIHIWGRFNRQGDRVD